MLPVTVGRMAVAARLDTGRWRHETKGVEPVVMRRMNILAGFARCPAKKIRDGRIA